MTVNNATRPPIMLATWSFGVPALDAAWPVLQKSGALDAVEEAGRYAESDLSNHTVGRGGLPDRDCVVSLDAAIMMSPAFSAGVCDVHAYEHPISIARRVAERTPHKLIAGRGAEEFAKDNGFIEQDLLMPAAKEAWEKWAAERQGDPKAAGALVPNFEEHPVAAAADRNAFHDTIGVLAIDNKNTLAGSCTTSGLPWKIPGRVGDSPIVGHGIYVDPTVGGCVCTGHGELVSGVCGAFLAVEKLRDGATPQAAAEAVLKRIAASFTLTERDQVGVIVLAADGRFGAAGMREGFKYALRTGDGTTQLISAPHLL